MRGVKMQAERSSAACRAPLRAHVIARLRAERGDTLIEVIIGALLVALIATATLGGFADIGHLSATQRNEEQAAALAQQDQARLRGLTIAQLSSNGAGTGNTTTTQQVDGSIYTITSKSQFISGTSGSAACTGSNSADEIQTTSTVTWGSNQGSRTPVVVHGEITPTEGGSLVASVVDPTGAGLAGVTINTSGGPTTTSPVTTDGSGCVVWAGLASGSYTVNFTPPAGTWIGVNGAAPSSQTVTVTATQTTHATQIQIGQAAGIAASFTTTFNGQTVAATSDQFVLSSTGMTPTPQIFGTDSTPTLNTYVTTITTPTSLYPYPPTLPSDDYFAWAGACAADEPTTPPPGFQITGGQTNPISISEPAMIILPYSGTATQNPTYTNSIFDQTNAAVTHTGSNWSTATHTNLDYGNTELDNTGATAGQSVTVALPLGTTSVTLLGTTTTASGNANFTLNAANAGSFDLYSTSTQYQQQLYQNTTLVPTTSYTLTMSAAGTVGHTGGGKAIDLDEIKYTTVSYTTTYSQGPLLTTVPHVIVTDTGCGSNKDYPPTQVPTPTQGALVSPGLPDSTFTVCVDDGTNHVTFVGVQNNNFTTGITLTANIYPTGGGSGRGATSITEGSGVCT